MAQVGDMVLVAVDDGEDSNAPRAIAILALDARTLEPRGRLPAPPTDRPGYLDGQRYVDDMGRAWRPVLAE